MPIIKEHVSQRAQQRIYNRLAHQRSVQPGSPEKAARDLVNYGQKLMPQKLQQTKELMEQHTCSPSNQVTPL
ncbi:hypothetical protein AAFF_G00083890 [Aldrovandia affinis]|uniref:Uncharacterized protein n=1 Tax=Aldrovandia affinis TaxID=143900 RepID=A0AAD7WCR1_9TELE|nr:hypothetical protein AAFF_G00083890 [Aldrovandia affinis]